MLHLPDARRTHAPPHHRDTRRAARWRATTKRAAATRPHAWEVHRDGHDVTVILTGALDCLSAPALSAQLDQLLAGHQPRRLVLDLAGVEFIDCAGIRPIVAARRALPVDRAVVLRAPARPIRMLLSITHVDETCQVEDS